MKIVSGNRRERQRQRELVVPHCVELDRQIVGLLLSPFATIDTASTVISAGFRPEHLFRLDYAPIARECMALVAEGVKPSTLAVSRRVSASELEAVRGHAGLLAITEGLPLYTPDQIVANVKDLADAAWRREQIERLEGYRDRLYDENTDVEALQVEPSTWLECAPRIQTAALLNDVTILETPDTQHVIRDLFPANALGMIAGATGSGKTHFALSASVATCLKTPWFGRFEIDTPGHVLFVAGEGAGGLKPRMQAAKQAVDCPPAFPLGIYLHLDGFSLQSDVDISMLLRRIPGDAELRLIFLDTWARLLLPGDENSQRDAGIGIAAMDRLRRATGATVVALHHLNASGDRERGSTALKAAVDTAIRIQCQPDGVRRVTCDKQRDIAPFESFDFTLQPVGPSVVPMYCGMAGAMSIAPDSKRAGLIAEAKRLIDAHPGLSNTQLSAYMSARRKDALLAIREARQL